MARNVDMSVAYSRLKYGVFNMTRFGVMRICIQYCECSCPRIYPILTHFCLWGRVSKRCSMSAWIFIPMVVYVF